MARRLFDAVSTRTLESLYQECDFQLKRVAERLGVSVSCVRGLWRRRGLPFPRQRAGLLTPNEAALWYASHGRSVSRAAQALHLDYHVVRDALEEFGVRLRKNKGALTFVDTEVIAAALKEGGNATQAARLLGVKVTLLQHEMRKRDLRSPLQQKSHDWSNVREWYEVREHSLQEIADHVGCDHQAVRNALTSRGVHVRTRAEGQAALRRHGRREVQP